MLVSGIAQRDLRAAQAVFMGVVIGALGHYTKDSINGRSTDWAADPVLLVAKGLKQAGTLGMVAQMPLDVATAAYQKKSVARSAIDAIPGVDAPAAGLLRAAANTAGAIQRGEPADAAKAASKLLPYQNLFYLRQLFNEMGDGERSALGLRTPSETGPIQSGIPFGG